MNFLKNIKQKNNIKTKENNEKLKKLNYEISIWLKYFNILYPELNVYEGIHNNDNKKFDEEFMKEFNIKMYIEYLGKEDIDIFIKLMTKYLGEKLNISKMLTFGFLLSKGIFNLVSSTSSLTGATLTKTTLAKIGGGAKASGGFGVIGGKIVLISIALTPLALYELDKKIGIRYRIIPGYKDRKISELNLDFAKMFKFKLKLYCLKRYDELLKHYNYNLITHRIKLDEFKDCVENEINNIYENQIQNA